MPEDPPSLNITTVLRYVTPGRRAAQPLTTAHEENLAMGLYADRSRTKLDLPKHFSQPSHAFEYFAEDEVLKSMWESDLAVTLRNTVGHLTLEQHDDLSRNFAHANEQPGTVFSKTWHDAANDDVRHGLARGGALSGTVMSYLLWNGPGKPKRAMKDPSMRIPVMWEDWRPLLRPDHFDGDTRRNAVDHLTQQCLDSVSCPETVSTEALNAIFSRTFQRRPRVSLPPTKEVSTGSSGASDQKREATSSGGRDKSGSVETRLQPRVSFPATSHPHLPSLLEEMGLHFGRTETPSDDGGETFASSTVS